MPNWNYFTRVIEGFFPETCAACESAISHKNLLCVSCMYELPITDLFYWQDNRFMRHFIGRVPLVHGAAYLDFYKEGIAQALMHKLKYKGKYYIGEFLGRMAAKHVSKSDLYEDIDLIIPVPIHNKRRSRRGFNQCEAFASGLSEILDIHYDTHTLIKEKYTDSQTAKTRIERIKNVEGSYAISTKVDLNNKHILLVDDVITTGATLEACALVLLDRFPQCKISMLTIAIAND